MERERHQENRTRLLEFYRAGLGAVDGRNSVRRALAARPLKEVWAVAVGKAASAMAQGALDALGADLQSLLVITKYGHSRPLNHPRARVIESAHPVPDSASLAAGAALLQFLREAPGGAQLLFLISGGTSALVEVLPEGFGESELAEVNRLLLGGGEAIGSMNAVRKRISCIKGGRLARYLNDRNTLQLLISDVPGDAPDVIGSGMLVPDRSSPPDTAALPPEVRQMMERAGPVPEAGDAVFASVETEIIASNGVARGAVARAAEAAGLRVFRHDDLLSDPPPRTAEALVSEVLSGEPGVYVWGGETPVTLPPNPGRGGRCQALALEIGLRIAGREDVSFLCGATDGTDGPTDDAGALVDGATVGRGEGEGLDAGKALARADAGAFLEAAGDLIQTGPTGTNVMDLVIAYKPHGT